MALFLMDDSSVPKIRILGRWASETFMVYIRPQVLEWTNLLSKDMAPDLNVNKNNQGSPRSNIEIVGDMTQQTTSTTIKRGKYGYKLDQERRIKLSCVWERSQPDLTLEPINIEQLCTTIVEKGRSRGTTTAQRTSQTEFGAKHCGQERRTPTTNMNTSTPRTGRYKAARPRTPVPESPQLDPAQRAADERNRERITKANQRDKGIFGKYIPSNPGASSLSR